MSPWGISWECASLSPSPGSAKRLLSLGCEGVSSDHIAPALPLLLGCPKGAAVPQHEQAQLIFGESL